MKEQLSKLKFKISKIKDKLSNFPKSKLTVRGLLLILVGIFVLLIVVNYSLNSSDIQNQIVDDGVKRVRIDTDLDFRKQVVTEYPQLVKQLPYLGEGCRIALDRDENSKEFLVIMIDPNSSADACGANIFLKRNLAYLDGIKVVEKFVDFTSNV